MKYPSDLMMMIRKLNFDMVFKTRQGDQNEFLIIIDLDRLARLVLLN